MKTTDGQKSGSTKFSHLGLVVKDLKQTMKTLEALGATPSETAAAPEGAEGMIYRGNPLVIDPQKHMFTRLGNIALEIFEPDETPSPGKEFMDKNGQGIHHIALKVDDVEKEVEKWIEQGAELLLTGKRNGKLGAAYLYLESSNLYFELVDF